MAQNVLINGVTYQNVPEVDIPKAGGGTAKFYDTATADAGSADVRNGKKYFDADGEKAGTMSEKTASTYKPSTSAQTISAGQYLAGAQTIEAVVLTGLNAASVIAGHVIKVGTTSDDDSILSLVGEAQLPTITQNSTTKILSIS